MAAAAGAAGAAPLGARSALAGDVRNRSAQQPVKALAAAGLAGGRLGPADEVFLFLFAVLADEFVEGHDWDCRMRISECGMDV